MEFLGNEMEALADTMQDASLEIQAQGTEVDRGMQRQRIGCDRIR